MLVGIVPCRDLFVDGDAVGSRDDGGIGASGNGDPISRAPWIDEVSITKPALLAFLGRIHLDEDDLSRIKSLIAAHESAE